MSRPASRRRRRSAALALVLALVLPALPALAQGRPDTRDLTCAAASALVLREGAVVMTTGPLTYERIVRDGGFCALELTTRPDYEATRDVRQCFVGYRCVEPLREGRDGP
ncbi:hypothetical protein [uncultured Methylobacterium sp.]|uniref:hypothetical protein n=1 Tax=uncultured Methylobacterium sp. TaxID=157278 RepID=UPI0035C9E247